MATNSALATAGALNVEASLLEQLATPQIVPAETPEASSGGAQTTQTPAGTTPQVVRIGEQEYTQAQIQKALEDQSVLSRSQDELSIGQTFFAMTPEQRAIMLRVAEDLSEGRDPLAPQQPKKVISGGVVIIPDSAQIVAPKWDDLSDGEQYSIAATEALRVELLGKVKELSGIVDGLRAYMGKIHTRFQDEETAKALTLKGFKGVTADVVREMRDSGFSDPVRALEFLQGQRKAEAVVAKREEDSGNPPPPDAPSGATGKFFDADDPKLSMGEMLRLLRNGYLPKNPDDQKRLRKLLEEAGSAGN